MSMPLAKEDRQQPETFLKESRFRNPYGHEMARSELFTQISTIL